MRHAIAFAMLSISLTCCVTPNVVDRFDVQHNPFPSSMRGRTVDVELTTGESVRLMNPTYENGWLTASSGGGVREIPLYYVRTARISANEFEMARKEKFGIFFGISLAVAYWQFNPENEIRTRFPY